jgi:hypothetical protein
MLGVAGVRLLPPHHPRPNLRRITNPQLVPAFPHQTLKPLRAHRSLDPYQGSLRQAGVKPPRFSVFILQPTHLDLAGRAVQHRDFVVSHGS